MMIAPDPIVAVRERHDGWTPAKQRLFLENLAETGVVKEAAQRIGMSEQGAYKLRLRKDAQPFAQGWKAALHIGRQRLIATAYERAINGTARPVFYKGEQIGETRTFSDKLLMMLIANPSFAGVSYSDDVMDIVTCWEDWTDGIEHGFPAPVIDEDEEWFRSGRTQTSPARPRRKAHSPKLPKLPDQDEAGLASDAAPLLDDTPVPTEPETTTMRIIADDLSNPDVAVLLQRHHDGMLANSPRESCHVLDIDALRSPEISFWTAWDGAKLAGCGALKTLDSAHGEIKSMRTHDDHLRKGVGAAILTHIIEQAKARGMVQLSLETGSSPPFQPALDLYTRFGFTYCAPFADYREDPFSRFMTLDLMAARGD